MTKTKKPHVEPNADTQSAAAEVASKTVPVGDAKTNDHAENLAAAPAPGDGEVGMKSDVKASSMVANLPMAQEGGDVVSVEVAPKTYQTLQALDRFAGVVKQVSENGWDMKEDIAPTLASLISDLGPAVQNFGDIGKEIQADKRKFINAVVIGLGGIASRWLK